MKQNLNQEIEYTSGFLNEDEEVNESDFDELAEEEEAGKLVDNQQKKQEGEEQPKKEKRPRKTIEQEIAELDAKRERLMEKKRRQDTNEKIVFGTTIIYILKYMKENDNKKYVNICEMINNFINVVNIKNKDIIYKIISNI